MELILDWKERLENATKELIQKRKVDEINRPRSLHEQLDTALKGILEVPQAITVFGNNLSDSWVSVKTSSLPREIIDSLRSDLAVNDRYLVLGLDPVLDGIVTIAYNESKEGSYVSINPMARYNWRQASDGEHFSDVKPIEGVPAMRLQVEGKDPKEIQEMVSQACDHILSVIAALNIDREAQMTMKR